MKDGCNSISVSATACGREGLPEVACFPRPRPFPALLCLRNWGPQSSDSAQSICPNWSAGHFSRGEPRPAWEEVLFHQTWQGSSNGSTCVVTIWWTCCLFFSAPHAPTGAELIQGHDRAVERKTYSSPISGAEGLCGQTVRCGQRWK